MKHPVRLSFATGPFLALASIMRAHPGHDGDHDFTWDFAHWTGHPLASAICLTVVAVSTWVAWRAMRRSRAAAAQSLRVSQASRGK